MFTSNNNVSDSSQVLLLSELAGKTPAEIAHELYKASVAIHKQFDNIEISKPEKNLTRKLRNEAGENLTAMVAYNIHTSGNDDKNNKIEFWLNVIEESIKRKDLYSASYLINAMGSSEIDQFISPESSKRKDELFIQINSLNKSQDLSKIIPGNIGAVDDQSAQVGNETHNLKILQEYYDKFTDDDYKQIITYMQGDNETKKVELEKTIAVMNKILSHTERTQLEEGSVKIETIIKNTLDNMTGYQIINKDTCKYAIEKVSQSRDDLIEVQNNIKKRFEISKNSFEETSYNPNIYKLITSEPNETNKELNSTLKNAMKLSNDIQRLNNKYYGEIKKGKINKYIKKYNLSHFQNKFSKRKSELEKLKDNEIANTILKKMNDQDTTYEDKLRNLNSILRDNPELSSEIKKIVNSLRQNIVNIAYIELSAQLEQCNNKIETLEQQTTLTSARLPDSRDTNLANEDAASHSKSQSSIFTRMTSSMPNMKSRSRDLYGDSTTQHSTPILTANSATLARKENSDKGKDKDAKSSSHLSFNRLKRTFTSTKQAASVTATNNQEVFAQTQRTVDELTDEAKKSSPLSSPESKLSDDATTNEKLNNNRLQIKTSPNESQQTDSPIKINGFGGTAIIPDDTNITSNAILSLIELNSKAPDQHDTKSILDISKLISTIAQQIEERSENSGKLSNIGLPNQASTSAPVNPEHTLYYNNLSEGKHVFSVAEKTSNGPVLKIYFDEKKTLTRSDYDNWAKTEVERFRKLNGEGNIVISGELPLGFVKAAVEYCAINNIDCRNNTSHTVEAPKVTDLDSIRSRFDEKTEPTTTLKNPSATTETPTVESPTVQNTESSTPTTPKAENQTPENKSSTQTRPYVRRTNLRQKDPLYSRPTTSATKTTTEPLTSSTNTSTQPMTASSSSESQTSPEQQTPTTNTGTAKTPSPTDSQQTPDTPPLDSASTLPQASKLNQFKQVLDLSTNICLDLIPAANPNHFMNIQKAMVILAEAKNWTIDHPKASNIEIEERFAKVRPLCEFLNKEKNNLSTAPQEPQPSSITNLRSQVPKAHLTGFDGLNRLIDQAIHECIVLQFTALLNKDDKMLEQAIEKEKALMDIRNKNENELPNRMEVGKQHVKDVINMKNEAQTKQNLVQAEKKEEKINNDSPSQKMHQ